MSGKRNPLVLVDGELSELPVGEVLSIVGDEPQQVPRHADLGNLAYTDLEGLTITESQISDLQTYLTTETDPVFSASEAASFVAGDKSKLDGIEAGATADQTAQEIATAIDADATAETTLKSALGLGSAAYTDSTAYDAAGTAASAVSTHESTYNHGTYITSADVTYETLNTNGDVGTGAGQLAIGNHNHSGVYEPADANIQTHISSTSNPHGVTASQVGLGSVTNDAQLKIASNLADLNNATTARQNLGVEIGVDVQAYDAATAKTGDEPYNAPTYAVLGSAAFADLSQAQDQRTVGWNDLISPISTAGVPQNNAPTLAAFGPSGLREEHAFAVGDYCFPQPYHVNHDAKPGGKAYVHVHWTTNGTSTATVKWEMQISRAKGHQQQAFGAPVSYYVEQAPTGTAWTHMVAEVSDADALTMTEPDELFIVTLRRVTNGGTDNADTVFGLTVDFHYESDRHNTINKAPNFYG